MECCEKFNEHEFPAAAKFYLSLSDTNMSEEDYKRGFSKGQFQH